MKFPKKAASLVMALTMTVGFTVPAMAVDTVTLQKDGPDDSIYTTKLSGVVNQEKRTFSIQWSDSSDSIEQYTETVYTVDPTTFAYFDSCTMPSRPDMEYSNQQIAYINCYKEENGVYISEEFFPDVSYETILKPEYADKYDMFSLAALHSNEVYIVLDNDDAPVDPANPFTDVSATAYYADAVKWAVGKNVTSGTSATTFSPDATCTTAQILTFLWRANGSPEPAKAAAFTDVSADAYYAKAASWAAEKGLVSGSTFGGDAPCTRMATVTYLWKLAGKPAASTTAAFTDVSNATDDMKAVSWAVEQGITGGTSATTFSPNNICTRGQIVTFLYRDMK